MDVVVNSVIVGKWKENCYLISCDNEAWIIDPGEDADLIINALNLDEYKLNGIINTHGHFDHIGAIRVLQEKYKIPFYIHSKDKRLATQGNLYRNMLGDKIIYQTPTIDGYLENMKYVELKQHKIVIHQTPGHTNGGVCFEINNKLIVGDTLLKSTLSLSNLPGGNKKLLLSSHNFLLNNFKDFVIYPGHGEAFTLDITMINEFKKILLWE